MSLPLQAPTSPLTDNTIRLRVPSQADVIALLEYSNSPSALEGAWLPVEPGASQERLSWIVGDWQRGWSGIESHNGPVLLLDVGGASRFVGLVGLGVRGPGVVELVYGIAPDWRGRGLATRAVSLSASWLAGQQQVQVIELRIGREHRASQRVAEKAGFRLAGTVRQDVIATGEMFEDLRYIFGPGREVTQTR